MNIRDEIKTCAERIYRETGVLIQNVDLGWSATRDNSSRLDCAVVVQVDITANA